MSEGRFAEAEALCRRSLAGTLQSVGEDHISTAYLLTMLATLRRNQKDFSEAEENCRRALRIVEIVCPEGTQHAATLVEYARVLRCVNRKPLAGEMEKRARAILVRVREDAIARTVDASDFK